MHDVSMTAGSSFGLDPWKGLVSPGNLKIPPQVRFQNDELLRNYCTTEKLHFQIWAFPGVVFLIFDEDSDESNSLISFHIQMCFPKVHP